MDTSLDLICIGTSLVDSIIRGFDPEPVSASGYRAQSGSLAVGGEAVNESMAAVKLGLRAGIFCFLGEDAAGDLVMSALERAGVDTSRVLRSADRPTPVTTIFVNADGTRKSITNGAHRASFHPERFPERASDARAVMLGSLFRAPFDDPGAVLEVVKDAKERGRLVFADTKLPNFRKLTLEDYRESLPYIDYITPNEDEARFCTGLSEPEAMADAFLRCGAKNVVIKLGAQGCYFKNACESHRIPACDVAAVDATGAGDNFLAGFAAEILRGASHREALRFANACGALCAAAVGAAAGLKSRAQVLELLERESAAGEM
ncbi:MAG: carbohydrate kinase family protein [Lachnospiraceae bacterium]|nr:carbohydrate kinase family protein [Lachnospiraceae bacterium]